MEKIYYYLVCYGYKNGDKKGDGRAFLGLDAKIDSFSAIREVELFLQDETGYNKILVKSFQEVSQGFIGDEEDGNKTYC